MPAPSCCAAIRSMPAATSIPWVYCCTSCSPAFAPTDPSAQCDPEAIVARATTPEKFTRLLRGDLDAIALKALAKDPAKRYPSGTALAEDLRRYLDGRLIEALPHRLSDRLRKLVRRNKT